ncbi:hypothetical protein [Sulfurimonas sp. HSL3-2]|uniref:hypothetical protein n=1 Tax=Hydrocurvibacter mobilis TaxID=3131936 RepID=UPI0031F95283
MILYGNEHKDRVEALATVLHEESRAVASLARSSDGIVPVESADAILTVWGHSGDATKFSEMLDVEFGVLIQAWKKKNPSLKSVELITCDAQHNTVPLAGYAKRVAKFVEEKYKDITIKALPVGQNPDDRSILWANAGTRTFCYITSPSQETFNHANQRLQALGPTYHNDLSEVGNAMAKERELSTPNNFTVNFGGFNNLRASLNVIKS